MFVADTLWRGRLRLTQPKRGCGYRFNIDSVLLAGFCEPAEHVIDLGAGCGIIGVLLLAMGKCERITAVELQPGLADCARTNAKDNGFADRMEVIEADLRDIDKQQADAVVFNPPYFQKGTGQRSPNQGRDMARHERNGTLTDFVSVAVTMAPSISVIVPMARVDELTLLCKEQEFTQQHCRGVHPHQGDPQGQQLIRAKQGKQAAIENAPPLIVHDAQGFTSEVRRWVEGVSFDGSNKGSTARPKS